MGMCIMIIICRGGERGRNGVRVEGLVVGEGRGGGRKDGRGLVEEGRGERGEQEGVGAGWGGVV